jgi:hypothetical protein
MSRGLGRVEQFVLAHLASAPPPSLPNLGYSAREIAAAMTNAGQPSRSAVSSVGRAMAKLGDAGLIEIREPQLRRSGANMFAVLR